MEKDQHNSGAGNPQDDKGFRNNQPGQQLPSGSSEPQPGNATATKQNERHSESSFPQQDEEILGTP